MAAASGTSSTRSSASTPHKSRWGASCSFLDAVLATAHEISVRRAGRAPAVHAAACLDFVTEERVLALAMMADAGDEVSSVVRFF